MTNIEMRFYELACSFFSKFGKKEEIDWEQRRYEIAKDAMTATFFGGNNGSPCYWLKDNPTKFNEMAEKAVMMADALIAKLKEDRQ